MMQIIYEIGFYGRKHTHTKKRLRKYDEILHAKKNKNVVKKMMKKKMHKQKES